MAIDPPICSPDAPEDLASVPSEPTGNRLSPIFVLGCGRSGTTLLRLMLASHPSIGIPPEGTFLMDLFKRYYRNGAVMREPVERFCEAVFSSDRFSEWNLHRDRVLARLRDVETKTYANLADAVYTEYLASQDGRQVRWGDKNIDYVMEIPKIIRLFPYAKIIHVIRDGRDVAVSYRNVDFGPSRVFDVAVFWRRRTLTGRHYGRWAGPDRYCEVRYEDLVTRPEQECRRVCEFVGEEFNESMLTFHEHNRRNVLVPKHRLAWHKHTLEPVTTSQMGKWERDLSEQDVMVFEFVAGTALETFGYKTHNYVLPMSVRIKLALECVGWVSRKLPRKGFELLRRRAIPPLGSWRASPKA